MVPLSTASQHPRLQPEPPGRHTG